MSTLPRTMRAATGASCGPIDDMITVTDGHPAPEFDPKRKGFALLKVHSCALAPGDIRVISGKTRKFQGPPSFPYVCGGDVAGVVEAVADGEDRLKVGDRVVARFHTAGPRGGMAEYAVVKAKTAEPIPPRCSWAEGAALASSGWTAMVVAERVKPGDRVLVLGGSGSVGTTLVQLLKGVSGAAYVAATSTQEELLTDLGCDDVIDYRKDDVWSLQQYLEDPFDVVIDLAGGGWAKAKQAAVVKSGRRGGRFLTVTPDKPVFEVRRRLHARRMGAALSVLHRHTVFPVGAPARFRCLGDRWLAFEPPSAHLSGPWNAHSANLPPQPAPIPDHSSIPLVGPYPARHHRSTLICRQQLNSVWQMLRVFVFPIIRRGSWSFCNRSIPRYSFIMGLTDDRTVQTRLFEQVQQGNVRVVLDTAAGSPFPFTTEGVRSAYRLQESRHSHGKVVVNVRDPESVATGPDGTPPASATSLL